MLCGNLNWYVSGAMMESVRLEEEPHRSRPVHEELIKQYREQNAKDHDIWNALP